MRTDWSGLFEKHNNRRQSAAMQFFSILYESVANQLLLFFNFPFSGRDFNILIYKYLSKQWEQNDHVSLKS